MTKRRSWPNAAANAVAWFVAVALAGGGAAGATEPQRPERVRVSGELVDAWCSVSGIMYAYGTAHHQCAVWCAVGGIPVNIRAEDGTHYMVLRLGDDAQSVAGPRLVTITSHQVTVEGDLWRRDGVNYLLVDRVADDKGVVNLTHDEYGIVPFGE
jgi:hypothetical protein